MPGSVCSPPLPPCILGGAELPVSWLDVAIQLSCGVTLVSWTTIALFDSLAMSSLEPGRVFTIGAGTSATYVVLSCVQACCNGSVGLN